MTIVKSILNQMPAVRQPQAKFFAILFTTILALRGHVTLRNLSRYCDDSERIGLPAFVKYLAVDGAYAKFA